MKDYVKINNNGSAFAKNGDFANAFRCFLEAANHEIPVAQYNLGTCYEFGNGTARNISVAVYWYAKATALGYKPAREKLESLVASAQSYAGFTKTGRSERSTKIASNAQFFLEGNNPDEAVYYSTLLIDYCAAAFDGDVECLVLYIRVLEDVAKYKPYLLHDEHKRILSVQSLVLNAYIRKIISYEEFNTYVKVCDWYERCEYIKKNKIKIFAKSFALTGAVVIFLNIIQNLYSRSIFTTLLAYSLLGYTLYINIKKYKSEKDTTYHG